jgi:hypothetical protein
VAGHRETSSNAATFPAEAAQICTVHDARDLPAQIRLPERELGPRIRSRVRRCGANGVHELVRKPLVNMSNTKLQDFVTQTAARSQITFGDVRRLRRDCLPGGINADEEVGILIWLDSTVSRADKAWSQWLVAAVADFALRSEVTEDGIVEWLKRLTATTAQGTTVRPRILREIGRGKRSSGATTSLPTDESSAAAQAAAADAGAHETPVDRPRQQGTSTVLTSQIKSKSTKIGRSRQRSRRAAEPSTMPASLIWSSGRAWKHACFPLAAPWA